MPKVAGMEVKWEKDSEAYKVTKSAPVEDLDEETHELLCSTALNTYRILKLRDYGRIDMRLTEKGGVRDRGQSESVALQQLGVLHGREKIRPVIFGHDLADRGAGPDGPAPPRQAAHLLAHQDLPALAVDVGEPEPSKSLLNGSRNDCSTTGTGR